MRKRILIIAISLCLWTVEALGVPTLQLNFPDLNNPYANPQETDPSAIYDADTQSWLLIENSF